MTIDEKNLPELSARLAARDDALRRVLETFGPPPLWAREQGFATLVHIILEQQVSLASAAAAFARLVEKTGEVTPENLLRLTDAELRACHFSRQKTVYARELAEAVRGGRLRLRELPALSDGDVRAALTAVKGIGPWTADIYLLMALRRPDVMPRGDLALHIAFQKLYGLERRPGPDVFPGLTARWRPYRSVAARMLWHFYLSEKRENFARSAET